MEGKPKIIFLIPVSHKGHNTNRNRQKLVLSRKIVSILFRLKMQNMGPLINKIIREIILLP